MIVLLPGMDGSGALLADFVAELAMKSIVVSYPPDRPLDYPGLQEQARAFLPQEPFILLGESFSGPIAIALAAEQHPMLRGLILVCAFATCPRPRLISLAYGLSAVFPLWRVPFAWISSILLGRPTSRSLRERTSAAIRRVKPSVWKARLNALATVDVSSDLPEIRVPILYLRASDDRLVPAVAGEDIRRLNSKAEIIELRGPHFLLQVEPRKAARPVADFAKKCFMQ